MKKLIVTILFLFPLLCFAQNDAALVKKCFGNYRDAIIQGRGSDAANCVDSKTIYYYNEVIQHVLHDNKAKLEQLSIFDRLMVLTVRHMLSANLLKGKDGKGLFILSIQEGLIRKSQLDGTDIIDVKLNGNIANAQMTMLGEKTPVFMTFSKEKNRWKLNLTSTFKQSDESIRTMMKNSKQSEDEFLMTLLKSSNKKEPSPTIWKPLL